MLKKFMRMLRGMIRTVLSPFGSQKKIARRMGKSHLHDPYGKGLYRLSPKEGAILVLDHGIEVYYPPSPESAREEVVDTLDFLRYALTRPDWQGDWHRMSEQSFREEAESAIPRLTVLEGGLPDEPYEN
jgi:hypothetical protein